MFSISDMGSYNILIILIYTVTVKLMRPIPPNRESFDRMMVANCGLRVAGYAMRVAGFRVRVYRIRNSECGLNRGSD
jgi:hypothetical protein